MGAGEADGCSWIELNILSRAVQGWTRRGSSTLTAGCRMVCGGLWDGDGKWGKSCGKTTAIASAAAMALRAVCSRINMTDHTHALSRVQLYHESLKYGPSYLAKTILGHPQMTSTLHPRRRIASKITRNSISTFSKPRRQTQSR